jgi:phosphoserine phosphatase RsbU/P
MATSPPEHMTCMEVWGGSQLTARGVEMGGLDAWVYSKPFEQADGGGDVYYASSCATGRINRLLLADVAGHGSSVAETAVSLRSLMRRYVNYLDQTEFVRSMNRRFAEMSTAGSFATAVVTTFFAPTGRLSICNAGHPHPLWFHANENTWTVLLDVEERASAQNIPLGILDLADYEQFDVHMQNNDLLVCYTDALSESRRPDGEMLGPEGLAKIAAELGKIPPENLIEAFLARIAKEHEGNLASDDVTVLLLRPNGRSPKITMRERLSTASRFCGSLLRSLNPRAERPPLPDFSLANIGGAIFPRLNKRWRGAPSRPPSP